MGNRKVRRIRLDRVSDARATDRARHRVVDQDLAGGVRRHAAIAKVDTAGGDASADGVERTRNRPQCASFLA